MRRQVERGVVAAVVKQTAGGIELLVEVGGRLERAYQEATAPVCAKVGDSVWLNTTAVRLGLGTGGLHFVMAVENAASEVRDKSEQHAPGHIMKMRYTPWQAAVHAVEEPSHPMHEVMQNAESLDGTPVVICELHSMLPAVVLSWRQTLRAMSEKDGEEAFAKRRVVYVMTDGGALPIGFSKTVQWLKEQGFLAGTVTVGHAYGGDVEAVNLYSGLLAARAVLAADCILVAMGPGIVGTGTLYGHTGIEVGQAVNAVHSLQGDPIVVPRISFADTRARHHGLSHHTRTALGRVALAPATIPLPNLPDEQARQIWQQVTDAGLHQKHRLVGLGGNSILDAAATYQVPLRTMGRSLEEDPAFFLAAGAAGEWLARSNKKPPRQWETRRSEVPLLTDKN